MPPPDVKAIPRAVLIHVNILAYTGVFSFGEQLFSLVSAGSEVLLWDKNTILALKVISGCCL